MGVFKEKQIEMQFEYDQSSTAFNINDIVIDIFTGEITKVLEIYDRCTNGQYYRINTEHLNGLRKENKLRLYVSPSQVNEMLAIGFNEQLWRS
jgi:hypothetical protein